MSSSPLDALRREEKFAALAVARAVGASALPHDIDGAQRAFDIELTYPDGRVAALEVTSHAGDGIRRRDALLAKSGHKWPSHGDRIWTVRVPSGVNLKELQARYTTVIDSLIALGLDSTADLWAHQIPEGHDELLWAIENHVEFWSSETTAKTGPTVFVLPAPGGGWVDEDLRGLGDALRDLLALPNTAAHVDKLRLAAGHAERHLFVVVHEDGLPEPVMLGMFGKVDHVASAAPELPEGLTHLWIASR